MPPDAFPKPLERIRVQLCLKRVLEGLLEQPVDASGMRYSLICLLLNGIDYCQQSVDFLYTSWRLNKLSPYKGMDTEMI